MVQAALALIDPVREPRLEICARHNLIWFLNDSGKPWEALALLETSRPLYRQFPDTWPRLSLRWVEGRIARNLGDLEDAAHTFQSLWQELRRRELHHFLTLLSIDLAEEVQVARGRHAEAVRLVREVHPLLQSWGMHTEGLALWLLFQESLAAGRIRDDTFRHMASTSAAPGSGLWRDGTARSRGAFLPNSLPNSPSITQFAVTDAATGRYGHAPGNPPRPLAVGA